jgi:hypothetical protein
MKPYANTKLCLNKNLYKHYFSNFLRFIPKAVYLCSAFFNSTINMLSFEISNP